MNLSRCLLYVFWLLNLALALGLLLGHTRLANPDLPPVPNFPQIAARDASQHLVTKDALFVDARPFGAFKKAFVPSAVSLPMGQKPSAELLEQLRKAPLLIVYCDGPDCRAAEEVARALHTWKFKNISVMSEGMRTWRELELPLQSISD